ncbi:MAG TPA: LacI family DNA-binding transcriptional regulator [Fimbriimonas sp.]
MPVTLRDVAKVAGASVAAVSSTLNGSRSQTIRVSADTRERIIRAALDLGYTANPIAKSLATGRTGVLGLMLPYADAFVDQNPFSMTLMKGVMEEAIRRHANVMLYTASDDVSDVRAAAMVDRHVDGLILVMPVEGSPIVHKLDHRGIPYVSILRKPLPGTWTVNSDDYRGGRLATRHLIELGHRRLMHFAGDPEVVTSKGRRQGFLDEAVEAGSNIEDAEVVPSGFDYFRGYESARQALQDRKKPWPTGIFAANDLCAQGVMVFLREMGLRLPQDVAIVGYDDTAQAETTHPTLTSVHMGIEEIGRTAVDLLLARIEGLPVSDVQPVLPVRLTVRESSGTMRANSQGGNGRPRRSKR